jgi:hypothetical protein
MIPFLDRLENSKSVLVAGCGGGFDVFAGVPLAQHLLATGESVVFANFSFTNLWLCGDERISPTMWRVDQNSSEMAGRMACCARTGRAGLCLRKGGLSP